MIARRQRNFADFLEKHFQISHAGGRGTADEIRFLCPFCHGGSSGELSFDVNLEKGVTRCWRATCGYRGSAGWFVKDVLGVDFAEAVKILDGEKDTSLSELKADTLAMFAEIEKRYSNVDFSMLGSRIDEWVVDSDPLSWSPMLDDVIDWLDNERGYDPEPFMDQHNLYVPPQQGKWEGRILFEVRSLMNRAYLAYSIWPDIKPKTINPPGAVLSKMLYNYNEAYHGETVFVCEGIFDSARLKSWGLHSVAIFGVNISIDQIYLLSKTKAKEICVLLDNGAEEAAVKVCGQLADYIKDKEITIMNITRQGADPDELEEDEFMDCFERRRRRRNGLQDELLTRLGRLDKLL
jgi:DNA primase